MTGKVSLSKFAYLFLALILTGALALSCDGDNTLVDEEPGPGPGLPGEGEFDADTAAELMFLSLEAYQMLIDNENGIEFTLPAPYELQIQLLTPEDFLDSPLPEEVPIAFVATSGDSIYLVFRGTKTIDEWISDADFPLVTYPPVANGGDTEKGFTDIYETLAVTESINDIASSGSYENLYVTGHSLGAALAVLAIPDVIEHTQFKNPVMYNFAGPRAGNSGFANLYDGYGITSWRVFNTNDVVPNLPPTELSYVHVDSGEPITFGQPVTNPFDFDQIAFNHSSCNYYSTVCDMTSGPASCKQKGEGLDGCSFSAE